MQIIQNKLFIKAIVTGLLALLLALPLGMVQQTVLERQARQARVVEEIAASSAGAQQIAGPLLVLPYVEQYRELEWVEEPVEGGGTTRVQRALRDCACCCNSATSCSPGSPAHAARSASASGTSTASMPG